MMALLRLSPLHRLAALAALALALFSAGVWQGRDAERAAWTARAAAVAAERDRLAARVSGLAEALAKEQATRRAMARKLEEDADADADAARIALPARSLQRLDAR